MISARSWNSSAKYVDSGKIRVGFEQTVGGGGNLPFGRLINKASMTQGLHPFTISPYWDGEYPLTETEAESLKRPKGAWCCNIVPGFINGHPPAIKVPARFLGNGEGVWGTDYGRKNLPEADQLVQVLLTDEPLPFLKLTSLADSTSKVYGAGGAVSVGVVPPFFRVLGAREPEQLETLDILGNILAGGGDEFVLRLAAGASQIVERPLSKKDGLPEGNRTLMQCDIVLQVDRPRVGQDFAYDDLGILRMAGFKITLPSRAQYSARIYTTGIYVPPRAPTYDDVISGTYEELPYDEIVLAQFYLLSPVYTDHGNIPDDTWMPFVNHQVFWNLNYASITQIDPFKPDTSLEFFKQIGAVLAGGTAFLIIASYVNPLEAAFDEVMTRFNQTAVKGQFWTG